jgi:hypothetical protein
MYIGKGSPPLEGVSLKMVEARGVEVFPIMEK